MRKLIVSLLAVGMLVLPLGAQSTRTNSLAIGGLDTADIGNLLTYPQLSSVYKNKVWIAPETIDNYGMHGMLISELSSYTVGALVETSWYDLLSDRYPGNTYLTNVTAVDLVDPDRKASLFFAGKMGTMNLGAAVSYAVNSEKTDEDVKNLNASPTTSNKLTDPDSSASYIGVVLGAGVEEVGPFASVDAAVGVGLPGVSSKYNNPPITGSTAAATTAEVKKDGGMDLGVDILAVRELSDSTKLRVQASYGMQGLDLAGTEKIDGNVDGDYADNLEQEKSLSKYSSNSFGARVALNKTVNTDQLLVVALGVSRSASTYESVNEWQDDTITPGTFVFEKQSAPTDKVEYSTLSIPMSMGVEGKVKDNLVARIGVHKDLLTIYKETETDDTYGTITASNTYGKTGSTVTEYSAKFESPLVLGVGFGWTLGNFVIDGKLNSSILSNGPYFLTGQAMSALNSEVDVVYSW